MSARLDSRADHAVEIRIAGSGRIEIVGDSGTAGTIEILVDLIRLRRTAAGSAVTPGPFEAHRQTGRPVVVLIDHGTVEIFADSGDTVLTAQVFAGPNWRLVAEGIDSIALL